MEDGIPRGLQHRHKTCCEKGGRRGRRACRVQSWHHRGDVVFRTGGLAYDIMPKRLLLPAFPLLKNLILIGFQVLLQEMEVFK